MMVWIPARGDFEAFYISALHIVSIYTGSASLFIELPRSTISIEYESAEGCQRQCTYFVNACSNVPSPDELALYPKPVGGTIRYHI